MFFAGMKTYRNTANHLPTYERSHVPSLIAQYLGIVTKYWRHAKSSVKCLSLQVYASLSLKISLAMENIESHAEH